MEPNEQNTNKQKTHRYREQTDSSQRGWGQGMWDCVKKVTGLSKIFLKTTKLADTDNSMVITRGKGGYGGGRRRCKEDYMVMEGD